MVHMTRTYCRMRGKDFVQKFMQQGFKNNNLGKGICPTLAIISNPIVRRALDKAKEIIPEQSNNQMNDEDMDTMMEYARQLTCYYFYI